MQMDYEYTRDELLRDQAFFVQPQSQAFKQKSTAADNAHVAELEAEVQKLKGELVRAKAVNDEMWDKVVRKVVKQATEQTRELRQEKEGAGDEERKRKRGRN
jgi:pre-rRNA-processing protein IPI3